MPQFRQADDEEFWGETLTRFPANHRTKQPLLTIDRILPMPQIVREALIKMYFDDDEKIQEEAKNDKDNKDCLLRVYLGERESVKQQSGSYDTLRNFPMRLNMMEDLDLNVSEFASEMAVGLAILHWQAQIDGMDVEFVLGSSATMSKEQPHGYDNHLAPPHKVTIPNFKRRAIQLWMLDFDKTSRIELTEHDVVTKLVPAFLGNDPYYPMPQVDQSLWNEFCSTYLKASGAILEDKTANKSVMMLPQRFLDAALKVLEENQRWNKEDFIVFED